ncbi:unnamed protein product, partial [Musa banksii]
MAKRRSRTSKLIKTKKVESKLEEAFTCPFCNHDKSVSCTLDTKLKIGEAQCWVCKESYATTIHHLTEPIDIYSEWVDECEKVDKSEELRDDDHRHSKKRRAILRPTPPLSTAVDLYSEWLDRCEEASKSEDWQEDRPLSKKRRA